ncbi:NAD(P)-dependent oxidoreductase [Sphingomonas gilva]|uniref:NAD(P)-dependent oxidoreductase n=1 Tax=Sphingomonas gilva TaxID=2305907 RepID=A0A396RRD4_9SPHN|nr:NAD(P)-dependent oxidoreductase [Sphingomonas gilva]RHW19227.1 NAD(P)-dependent oxidoreductase [Sphingomonas gilva]
MERRIALIGFGEAAQAFAGALAGTLSAYDRKTDAAETRAAKQAEFASHAVAGQASPCDALAGADAALSLVTADQALAAAEAAEGIATNAFWFDMNSVAPGTKRAAAQAIARRGGRYVDVAVMAPVHPARAAVPLLASGPDAAEGAALLRAIGFASVSVVDGPVGAASAIKLIRSIMVKGIEALSAECVLAAEAAGVRDAVIASLDASWPGADWARRFDYNLDRMIVHGARRAAEMDEAVAMLDTLGAGSAMSRAAAARQRAIGGLGIASPQGLDAKLAALRPVVVRERAA